MAWGQAQDQIPFLGVPMSVFTPVGSYSVHLQLRAHGIYLLHPWNCGQ